MSGAQHLGKVFVCTRLDLILIKIKMKWSLLCLLTFLAFKVVAH